jgi:hypothetical protein
VIYSHYLQLAHMAAVWLAITTTFQGPAVVVVKNGTARVILRRENEADLLALDVNQAPRQIS